MLVLAWWIDSTAGYHGVMSVLLLPAWFASGAMFPLPSEGLVGQVLRLNPMSYMVDATRRALHGSALPEALAQRMTNPTLEWSVLVLFMLVVATISVRLARRRDL